MILQTKELYVLQDKLQKRILKEHNLSQEETKQRRILALLVEVGELANETRCFKYWSRKGASEQNVVLEEYVDGLHFLLCIGLDMDAVQYEVVAQGERMELSEMFMEIYAKIHLFKNTLTKESFTSLFSYYVYLGECLGFHNSMICEAYFKKNEENHQRQDHKY